MSVVTWLAELWSLRVAEQRARVLEAPAREELSRALAVASEHRDAAVTLFEHGHRARALAFARQAASALAAVALDGEVARAREASGAPALESGPIPELDRDIEATHARSFTTACAAHFALDRALAPYAKSPERVRRQRLERRVLVALVVVVAALGLARLALANRWKPTASASVRQRGPEKAIDGNVEEAWLLPPATTGWLDLTARRPRNVSSIRLCPPLGGVGAKKVDVAFYRAGALAKELHLVLDDEGGIYPAWTTIAIHEPAIERVRISVVSWIGTGGGLGDVQLVD